MSEPIGIRRLIERLNSGDIRIPAFQRDFVWDADQVSFLLDSIYKGFPIGTIILWKTDNRLSTEKKLGCFTLPEPRRDYPVNYVLDGQQRITSLFSVFQSELEPSHDEWVDIYFDMEAEESIQESMFIPLNETEVDSSRHFPVNVLFDSVKYRRATQSLSEDIIEKIDILQERFKEYLLPSVVFESDDRNNVAIVFERINRAGTELNIFQLLSAWSWSDSFDLTDKFEDLQSEITDHGFEELCKDRDLQLRICAGVIKKETTPSAILSMQGEEIRSNFDSIQKGIIGAIDFFKRELNIKNYKLLPFPGLMVPLSVFFSTTRTEGLPYSDIQKEKIIKWFWRSVFTRRYSAGVNLKQQTDIYEMQKLKDDENCDFKFPDNEIKFDFTNANFSVANANSKSFILLLSTLQPYSFLSGAKIDLDNVLQKANKNEFHHIFPKKHLERANFSRGQINVLANICFLTRADNNIIKDKAPADYSKNINQNYLNLYTSNALIPNNFGDLEYLVFLEERANMLKEKAFELMG